MGWSWCATSTSQWSAEAQPAGNVDRIEWTFGGTSDEFADAVAKDEADYMVPLRPLAEPDRRPAREVRRAGPRASDAGVVLPLPQHEAAAVQRPGRSARAESRGRPTRRSSSSTADPRPPVLPVRSCRRTSPVTSRTVRTPSTRVPGASGRDRTWLRPSVWSGVREPPGPT